MKAVVVVFAVIFGIGILVRLTSQELASARGDGVPSSEQKAVDEAKWQTAFGGAVTLRKRMRNPDSFKTSLVLEMPDGAVCYVYRAQNGFGGMDVGRAVVVDDRIYDENALMFRQTYKRECVDKTGVDKSPDINEGLKMVAASE